MYIRKTKTVYILIWQGEEIDETDTRKEAQFLRQQYNIAFGGGVTITRKRRKINND